MRNTQFNLFFLILFYIFHYHPAKLYNRNYIFAVGTKVHFGVRAARGMRVRRSATEYDSKLSWRLLSGACAFTILCDPPIYFYLVERLFHTIDIFALSILFTKCYQCKYYQEMQSIIVNKIE